MTHRPLEKDRRRAPSKRSLETRARIFDAAEALFARSGFDGASIRDIAQEAGVTPALVDHHGGGKRALFESVVARRAGELSQLRLDALATLKAGEGHDLRGVLSSFVTPFLDRALAGAPEWQAYGRLIAHVSSDTRWQALAAAEFNPTVAVFLGEIGKCRPDAPPEKLGAAFVFMVSAMLSVCESRWRVESLGGSTDLEVIVETLLDFCESGFDRIAGTPAL